MPHCYLSAAHKSSGKTSVGIGLCAALGARGESVQAFKKGPDYIDPLWLSQATGHACYNLDFYTMRQAEISSLFSQHMQHADIGLIEGNKGLYDGLDLQGSNSNAALAAQLDSPVILVLDTQGMTRGIAPLILGYQAFDENIRIAGVILNKVGGARHESKLRQVIEHYTDVPVLGGVQGSSDMHINERHLGLVPSIEVDQSRAKIALMGQRIAEQVDLTAVRKIAHTAGVLPSVDVARAVKLPTCDVTIAYAKDAAFGFYYADDLMALQEAGARLVPFSPIHDSQLPWADALFLGGGFPETHIDVLAQNNPLGAQICDFIQQGRPAYAECGGLMYLCRSLTWQGKQGKMLGVIPADVVMHAKPQGRGYVRLRATAQHPWLKSGLLAAHEFHYSSLENMAADIQYAYRVERGYGINGKYDGIRYKNLLAGYAHLRHTQDNPWAKQFVGFIRQHKA